MRAETWTTVALSVGWFGCVTYLMRAGSLGDVLSDRRVLLVTVGFYLAGVAVLLQAVASAYSVYSVSLDSRRLVGLKEILGWKRERVVPRWLVQSAREHNFQRRGTIIDRSVEIVYADGAFRIPCASVEEQQWLLGEIDTYLRSSAT